MSEDTLGRLLRLLRDKDIETRCAAAIVLGRLRPLEDRTIEALRRGLREAPLHARSYFLDALARTRDRRVVPDIVAVLEEKGSIVDQAVGILRGFGKAALDAIESHHKGEKAWLNGAFIKAVAGIHQMQGARMLMQRLPYTSWEEARGTSLFIAGHFHQYPAGAQAWLSRALRRMIVSPPEEMPAYGLITCLKLAKRLQLPVPPDALLDLAENSDTPSLRRHALDALSVQIPDAKDLNPLRKRLFKLLAEDQPEVSLPAAEVLQCWRKPVIPLATLRQLAEQDSRAVKEWAVAELVRRGDRKLVPLLVSQLNHEDAFVRRLAAQTLASFDRGQMALFAAFSTAEDSDSKREWGSALINAGFVPRESELEELRRRLAEGFARASMDMALLHFLGHQDREGVNSFLLRRARALLRKNSPEVAIHTLQPLVRHRYGSHDVRFVLALANLAAASDLMDGEDRRLQRCVDILSPLCRVHDFDLLRRLRQQRSMTPSEQLAIARGLSRRGGMEKALCRKLMPHIPEDSLNRKERAILEATRLSLEL